MNKWKEITINNREIATAIFNHLEKKGYIVNRKRGVLPANCDQYQLPPYVWIQVIKENE